MLSFDTSVINSSKILHDHRDLQKLTAEEVRLSAEMFQDRLDWETSAWQQDSLPPQGRTIRLLTDQRNASTVSDIFDGARSAAWRSPFLAVLLTAAVLRLCQLNTESLWIDEGFSIRDAVTTDSVAKSSKPLYFWLLSAWIKLGDADWFLRLPSVIFGVAAVALVFEIGRLVWGLKAGTAAGLLAAISPMQVNHSQEVRMYTLVMVLALASAYLLVLTIRSWRFRYMLACGICTYLAIITQPLAALMLLPQNAAVLDAYLHKRRPLLPWLTLQAAVIAAWLPFLPHVLGFGEQYNSQLFLALMERPSVADIPIMWAKFLVGDWSDSGALLYRGYYAYTYFIVVLMVLVIWKERRRFETRFIAAWLLLPMAALLLVLTRKQDMWVPRHVLFVSAAVFLLLGAALSSFRSRAALILVGILLFTPPIIKLTRYYVKTYRPQWRQATEYMMAHLLPTDSIAVYRASSKWVFMHYYHGRAKWTMINAGDFLENPEEEFERWDESTALKLLRSMPTGRRRWLAISRVPPGAAEAIDSALKAHYRMLDSRDFSEVKLYLLVNQGS